MSSTRLISLLAVLLALACCPAAAVAAPDPSTTAQVASLVDDGLTAYAQQSSPSDPTYFADGTWHSGSSVWWAYTQGGPTSAAALLWRSTGQRRDDLFTMAESAGDTAIATHQRADGAFVGDPGDSQGPGITTNMYARELGIAYLALEPGLDGARKAAWQTAIARAADYLLDTGELTYYTNGNIELGEIELFYLASRITGQQRFADAYEADWAFTLDPPKPRWDGYGLQMTTPSLLPDGRDGAGYLAEAGSGAPGFDPEYTGVQLDVVTRLWALSHDPRALRLMNLETNTLLPRVTSAWQLDTSNGTRHADSARTVPFTTQALTVLAGDDRPELAQRAAAQWPTVASTYRSSFRTTNVVLYKELGNQLATTLLAAMSEGGNLSSWLPAAAPSTPVPAATPVPTTTPAATPAATPGSAPTPAVAPATTPTASPAAPAPTKLKAIAKAKAIKKLKAKKKQAKAARIRAAKHKAKHKAAKRKTAKRGRKS